MAIIATLLVAATLGLSGKCDVGGRDERQEGLVALPELQQGHQRIIDFLPLVHETATEALDARFRDYVGGRDGGFGSGNRDLLARGGIPHPYLLDAQGCLDARLQDHIGRRDGQILAVFLRGVELRRAEGMLLMRQEEALDGRSTTGLDWGWRDLGLDSYFVWGGFPRLDGGEVDRILAQAAAARERGAAGAEDQRDDSRIVAAEATIVPELQTEVGDEWRCFSAYFCEGDSTGAYCGITASGVEVHLGVVACRRNELGRCFLVDGFLEPWCCEDTGGPRVEYDGCLDFWAHNLAEALQYLPPQRPGGFIRWVSP